MKTSMLLIAAAACLASSAHAEPTFVAKALTVVERCFVRTSQSAAPTLIAEGAKFSASDEILCAPGGRVVVEMSDGKRRSFDPRWVALGSTPFPGQMLDREETHKPHTEQASYRKASALQQQLEAEMQKASSDAPQAAKIMVDKELIEKWAAAAKDIKDSTAESAQRSERAANRARAARKAD